MPTAFLLLFTLFWSGITLGFDGYMAHHSWQQFQTLHYPCVEGKVIRSELERHDHQNRNLNDRSAPNAHATTTYTAAITYAYTVGTRALTGDRLRFNKIEFSNLADAAGLVDAHPAGASVTVYYDPAQPEEAVLFPGIEGADFMLVLFLTPFNMLMLGFWYGCAGMLRERRRRAAAAGVSPGGDEAATVGQRPPAVAVWWGLGTAGGLGFVSTLAVGLSTHSRPSIPLVLTAIVLIYGGGLAAYLWQRTKINFD